MRERVRQWVHDECIPAEKKLIDRRATTRPCWANCAPRPAPRASGAPSSPRNTAAWGSGPLANALVQMELGESYLGALSMNTQGPDDATMLTLLTHGTEYQKEKFLKPLLNGEKRICYSMTEKAAGADATGMQTRAVKDGNENYVLNGEKWFSSAASAADIALVMAKTDPDAPRHQQFSTFIVELPNPGYRIMRDIPTMAAEGPLSPHHGRRPLRDRDQGPGGAGREPARRRGPRLQHGPAPPGLRPPAPRHAQRRHGPAGARHGDRPRHPALDLRQAAASARACSSCSPSARPSSTSRA